MLIGLTMKVVLLGKLFQILLNNLNYPSTDRQNKLWL